MSEHEGVITLKTIIGGVIGVTLGFLILPFLWVPLLKWTGGGWVTVIISLIILIFGYFLVKYAEGYPDIIGAIILMLGMTLFVFAIWYWAPYIALHIPIAPPVTVGLILGIILFVIGLIVIAANKTWKTYYNDLSEIVGLLYGGLMIYVWIAEYVIVPVLEAMGLNIKGVITPVLPIIIPLIVI